MNREELGCGEEVVAGQAGVGVRAALLQRQPAGAVRQRLLGAREVLLRPRGIRQWPARVERDGFAADVDALLVALPLAAQRLVLDLRVAGSHLGRVVIEQPPDAVERDLVVDEASRERVAELVRRKLDRLAAGVADLALGEPAREAAAERRPGERQRAVGIGPQAWEQEV